jgi:hypothetical protein
LTVALGTGVLVARAAGVEAGRDEAAAPVRAAEALGAAVLAGATLAAAEEPAALGVGVAPGAVEVAVGPPAVATGWIPWAGGARPAPLQEANPTAASAAQAANPVLNRGRGRVLMTLLRCVAG